MKELRTQIEIGASADRVWDVLTDFSAFPDWNPFVQSARGEPRVGEQLTVTIKPPKGMGMTFKPKVLKAEPGRELRWLGKLMMPGLFDGEHIFEIESTGDNTARLTQREEFRGVLVPLFSLMGAFKSGRAGFEQMNQALKERAEQAAE